MKRRTFLFLKRGMELGGIEIYLIKMIRALKERNERIIFLKLKNSTVAEGFKEEVLDGLIEIIDFDVYDIHCIKKLNISFDEKESVIAYAFSMYQYAVLERIKSKFTQIEIDSFYWVPHFKGKDNFIELEFPFFLQFIIKKIMRKLIIQLEKNENIIYVSRLHAEIFEKNYNYKIEYSDKKFAESIPDIRNYDYSLEQKRLKSRKEKFNIITVGRFDFPHKAYILGLIHSFAKLKEVYTNLELTIIGYGSGKNKVIAEINKLPETTRNSIHLVGKVQYQDLDKYFELAHLNIGVATTIIDGAMTGLISIPVRHYFKVCEGYGFLPESKEYEISSAKGQPIEKYIQKVIKMDDEQYAEYSKKAYHTYADMDIDLYWDNTINAHNRDSKKTLPKVFLTFTMFRYQLAKIFRKFKKLKVTLNT